MEIEEYMFHRPKYTLLVCGITVTLLGLLAVGTTIGAIAWQEIVVHEPSCPAAVTNQLLCQRRTEGLFRICPGSAAIGTHCEVRSYGHLSGDEVQDNDDNYKAIIHYRLSTSVVFICALFLTAVATVITGIFVHFWINASEDNMFLLIGRLVVALLFVLSGILYQVALILLHFSMLQEKTLHTKQPSDIYTRWPRTIQRTTSMYYSVSYMLFWIALGAVYVASILLFFGSVYASQYYASYEESSMECFTGASRYPRFSMDQSGQVEKIFLVNSPEQEQRSLATALVP